jgi:hypothetical protein
MRSIHIVGGGYHAKILIAIIFMAQYFSVYDRFMAYPRRV